MGEESTFTYTLPGQRFLQVEFTVESEFDLQVVFHQDSPFKSCNRKNCVTSCIDDYNSWENKTSTALAFFDINIYNVNNTNYDLSQVEFIDSSSMDDDSSVTPNVTIMEPFYDGFLSFRYLPGDVRCKYTDFDRVKLFFWNGQKWVLPNGAQYNPDLNIARAPLDNDFADKYGSLSFGAFATSAATSEESDFSWEDWFGDDDDDNDNDNDSDNDNDNDND